MRGSPTRRSSAPNPSPGSWGSSEDITVKPSPSARDATVLRRRQTGRTDHPLGGNEDHGSPPDSRPALRRLTSETERQVAESSRSGSERGSLDMLRMSATSGEGGGGASGSGSREVEVLIHHVKAVESLAGIALLYGIDLATLRKANKLWPSDPVHLRTHLYVPLDACRWNKASETFMRGPEEGQVTLIPKSTMMTTGTDMGKGKSKQFDRPGPVQPMDSSVVDDELNQLAAWNDEVRTEDLWIPSKTISERDGVEASRSVVSLNDEDENSPRILDVVRIPNSQLRFFPKPRKPPDVTPRHSLENEIRRGSLDRTTKLLNRKSSIDGPSIQNNLRKLPRPLQPAKPLPTPPRSGNIVRLRPPSIPKPSGSSNNLANRLSSLFVVPPPPPIFMPTSRSQPRLSMESTLSSNISSSPARPTAKQPEVVLEMHPRTSLDPAKVNGGWVPVSEGRKSR